MAGKYVEFLEEDARFRARNFVAEKEIIAE